MGRRLTSLVQELAREARRRGRHDLAAGLMRYAHDLYDPRTDRGLADLLGEEIAPFATRRIVVEGPIVVERSR